MNNNLEARHSCLAPFVNAIRTSIFIIIAFILVATLYSCDTADSEYSQESCYFVFDNSIHQDPTLASSMNPNAPGTFCRITESQKSGATIFSFANNQGSTSTQTANAIDMQRARKLGQQKGIIVGYGNGDITNPIFYAYDNQCPNCMTTSGLQSFQLTLADTGIASCVKCGRTYDMNNGGYETSGREGEYTRLIRYRATTTGAYGILSVSN